MQGALGFRAAQHPARWGLRTASRPAAHASGRPSSARQRRRGSAAAAAAAGGGKGHHEPEHDPHQLTNVDAEPMLSDPGDLGRVAEGVMKEGQPQQAPRRGRPRGTARAGGGAPKGAGARGGGRGRAKKGDPHQMTNVDVAPMTSDPGDLGRVAPGVLEKYEHLEKIHPASHSTEPSSAAAAGAGAGAGAGEQQPEAAEAEGKGGAAAGAAAGPAAAPGEAAAGSEMLQTDSPGAAAAQHPGEVAEAQVWEGGPTVGVSEVSRDEMPEAP